MYVKAGEKILVTTKSATPAQQDRTWIRETKMPSCNHLISLRKMARPI